MRILILFILSAFGATLLAQPTYKTTINVGSGGSGGSGPADSVGIVMPKGGILQGTDTKAPYSTDSLKWDAGLYVEGPVNLTSLNAGTPDSALYIDASGFVGKMGISAGGSEVVDSFKMTTSDQTRTSTTYSALDEISYVLESGSAYVVEATIIMDTLPPAGIKLRFAGTVTVDAYHELIESSPSEVYGTIGNDLVAIAGPETPAKHTTFMYAILVVDTGGTFGIEAAQFTGAGGTSTIQWGSVMRLRKL